MQEYLGGGLETRVYGPSESRTMVGVGGFGGSSLPVLRAGDIERIAILKGVMVAAGSLTIKLLKNGSETGDSKVYTPSDDGVRKVWTLSSPVAVAVGDEIGLKVETDADYDMGIASSCDLLCGVEVEL